MKSKQQRKKEGALSDIRVIDLAGPIGLYCTKQLAEMGADVIRIEPPGGDPARNIGPFFHDEPHPEKSLYFFHFNANKRSITLNIEAPQGREILKKLVRGADVMVETFPPRYLEGLGLGYEELKKNNLGIILTSITPFGQTGPYSDYQACDMVGVAMGGLMGLSGFPDEPPNCLGGYQGYNLAGLNGTIGTLIALCYRDLTGDGQHVDVSMQESVITSTELVVPLYYIRRRKRKRTGRQVFRGWSEIFPCKDGYTMCSPFGGGGWQRLLAWADSEGKAENLTSDKFVDLLDTMGDVQMDRQVTGPRRDPRALANRGDDITHVEDVWERFCLTHTMEELYQKCQSERVRLCPIYNAADQLKDPQFVSRQWFTPVEYPELRETLIDTGPPYRFSKTPWSIYRRAPLIGEHNTEIYKKELGFSRQDLINLKQTGVI